MNRERSIMIEKPFSCDVDSCSMKFTNEDHLVVHKKKHDMVLNLGLAPRGNTFSDQTPTPTRFIRNCEEVGLFQDLQNVNPFEETFRKAAEAIKMGQAPILDKTSQSNAPDDTLHTPNIFPHIIDLQCINNDRNFNHGENKQPQEEVQKKSNEGVKNDEKEIELVPEHEPRNLILGNVSHKKRKINCDKPLIIKSQNDSFVNEMNSENGKPNQSTELNEAIGEVNSIHLALKEKFKNNLQSKQLPTIMQLKVPIPKSNSANNYQKSLKDKFSTFSKNSLKYETKLVKQQSGIFDLSKKRRARKSYIGLPKERIDVLERNRAAATRCREKKKSYISYLERLSRELTETNKKLHLQNLHFRKKISILQSELLKHQNCNVTTLKGDSVHTVVSTLDSNKNSESVPETEQTTIESIDTFKIDHKIRENLFKCGLPAIFDTVEVSLSENKNCLCFATEDASNIDETSSRLLCKEDRLRNVFSDHSYSSLSNSVEARKRYSVPGVTRTKVNANVLPKEIKLQNVPDKNEKESINSAVVQEINHSFGTSGSSEPLIIFTQPNFVLKTPISRESKSQQS